MPGLDREGHEDMIVDRYNTEGKTYVSQCFFTGKNTILWAGTGEDWGGGGGEERWWAVGTVIFTFFHISGNVSPSLFSLGPKSSENVKQTSFSSAVLSKFLPTLYYYRLCTIIG